MLIAVDPHSGVPVYRQLMEQIKLQVASGLLAPGEELPSTRSLSADLGVNPMTISKAYGLLEREGVVERRPGRPLVVRDLGPDRKRDTKVEWLREALGPLVRIIGQLGISRGEALRVFEEMLDREARAESSGPEEDER
jgi:GntR family transcriptional regulator